MEVFIANAPLSRAKQGPLPFNPTQLKGDTSAMPQHPFKIAELAEILAGGNAHSTAESIAAPVYFEEEQQDPSAATKPPRRRLTNAAKAKIANRCESNPSFERHSRKCQICSHPDIDGIEEQFIAWASANWIAEAFELTDESTIYRHARAAGLDVLRRENLSFVVEKVLQEVDNVETPTVSEVLRAARILARLNGRGQWAAPVANEPSNRQTYEELEVGVRAIMHLTQNGNRHILLSMKPFWKWWCKWRLIALALIGLLLLFLKLMGVSR
jgi:hypothetical protein